MEAVQFPDVDSMIRRSSKVPSSIPRCDDKPRRIEDTPYSVDQFETLLNNVPLGVFVVDADFKSRLVNSIALPVFGEIPHLIGRDFDEVMHRLWTKNHADEVVGVFRHTLESGVPYEIPECAEHRIDRNVDEAYEWH